MAWTTGLLGLLSVDGIALFDHPDAVLAAGSPVVAGVLGGLLASWRRPR